MESDKDIYVVHWGDLSMDTYLYGSSLTLNNYRIVFENKMMPPEVAIKKWHMISDYSKEKNEPLLPFLEPGRTYHIRSYIESVPKNRWFIRINFYDTRDRLVSFFMTNKDKDTFTFPIDCYYYDMQLLRGNADKIVFERIDLYLEEYISTLEEAEEYTVLCLEPQASLIKYPSKDILDNIKHPIILPGREESELFNQVISMNQYKKLTFIGYGPVSRRIAHKLHKQYPRSEVVDYKSKENSYFTERFTDKRYILEKMK